MWFFIALCFLFFFAYFAIEFAKWRCSLPDDHPYNQKKSTLDQSSIKDDV